MGGGYGVEKGKALDSVEMLSTCIMYVDVLACFNLYIEENNVFKAISVVV